MIFLLYFSIDDLESPFPCQLCGKCFMSNTSLKKHTQFHSKNSFSCKSSHDPISSVTERDTSGEHLHSPNKHNLAVKKGRMKSKHKVKNKTVLQVKSTNGDFTLPVSSNSAATSSSSSSSSSSSTIAAGIKTRKAKTEKVTLPSDGKSDCGTNLCFFMLCFYVWFMFAKLKLGDNLLCSTSCGHYCRLTCFVCMCVSSLEIYIFGVLDTITSTNQFVPNINIIVTYLYQTVTMTSR